MICASTREKWAGPNGAPAVQRYERISKCAGYTVATLAEPTTRTFYSGFGKPKPLTAHRSCESHLAQSVHATQSAHSVATLLHTLSLLLSPATWAATCRRAFLGTCFTSHLAPLATLERTWNALGNAVRHSSPLVHTCHPPPVTARKHWPPPYHESSTPQGTTLSTTPVTICVATGQDESGLACWLPFLSRRLKCRYCGGPPACQVSSWLETPSHDQQ